MTKEVPIVTREVALDRIAKNRELSTSDLAKQWPEFLAIEDISWQEGWPSKFTLDELRDAGRQIWTIYDEVRAEFSDGDSGHREFDRRLTTEILNLLPISPDQAAKANFWDLFTAFMAPGPAMWRYKIKDTGDSLLDRHTGANLARSTYARLWWRAYLLGPELANQLGENQHSQLFERSATLGIGNVIPRAIAQAVVDLKAMPAPRPTINGDTLISETGKRLVRKFATVNVGAMDDAELAQYVRDEAKLVIQAFEGLKSAR